MPPHTAFKGRPRSPRPELALGLSGLALATISGSTSLHTFPRSQRGDTIDLQLARHLMQSKAGMQHLMVMQMPAQSSLSMHRPMELQGTGGGRSRGGQPGTTVAPDEAAVDSQHAGSNLLPVGQHVPLQDLRHASWAAMSHRVQLVLPALSFRCAGIRLVHVYRKLVLNIIIQYTGHGDVCAPAATGEHPSTSCHPQDSPPNINLCFYQVFPECKHWLRWYCRS